MTPITAERPVEKFAFGVSTAPGDLERIHEDQRRLRVALERLAELQLGWDGEDGRAIDRLALKVAVRFADSMLAAGFSAPEVFPVPDGGVQFEWAVGPIELEVEIVPGARTLLFVCDDEGADQQIDGMLPRDGSRFALALARLRAHL